MMQRTKPCGATHFGSSRLKNTASQRETPEESWRFYAANSASSVAFSALVDGVSRVFFENPETVSAIVQATETDIIIQGAFWGRIVNLAYDSLRDKYVSSMDLSTASTLGHVCIDQR